jgi:hypothetical protein
VDNIAFCTHLEGAQNNGPRRGFARTVSEHERKTFALAFEFYEPCELPVSVIVLKWFFTSTLFHKWRGNLAQ